MLFLWHVVILTHVEQKYIKPNQKNLSVLSKKKSKHPVIKLQQKISNALFELGESYKELTMNQKENR